METIKVEGHSNLVKDKHSKAIVNIDKGAYENYLEIISTRNSAKEAEENRIRNLENKVENITNLLTEILNKVSK